MNSKRAESWLIWIVSILVLILANQLSGLYFFRLDLTEEKRYSIKSATKDLLQDLDDEVFIDVYLEGELNAGFKRLQRSIRETLEEFEIHSNHKVKFSFTDPNQALSQRSRNEFMRYLSEKGITPTNVIDTRDGNRVERIIFPGALINYGGVEQGAMLLSGSRGEEQLNSSIENVEYNLASAIYKLTSLERKKIAFLTGHGELQGPEIMSFQQALYEFYDISEVDTRLAESLDPFDLVIIAKPTRAWGEVEKFKLDQYIMKGGKALMLLDMVDANMDSAGNEMNVSFPYDNRLDDLLFRYGIRVNMDLVQDNNAALYPIVVGNMGEQAQIVPLPWPYFPIVNRFGDHPVSRNLDGVLLRFANSLDTVKADGIKKTPLLFSSDYSRTVQAPAQVSVADLRNNLKPEDLSISNIPMAYLLEGSFTSLYKNRFLPEGINQDSFVEEGKATSILVVADGDIARNDLPEDPEQVPELGLFRDHGGIRFSNREFLMNAVSYMLEEDGIITARNKQVSIRPLDDVKINRQKSYWQFINLALPLLLTVALGAVLFFVRRSHYTKFGKR